MFQHNYLSHYITQDTQAIYRGLAPQVAMMRAASGMTRSIDQRRPRALNDIQLAEVGRHPEVKLLQRSRKSLAKRIRANYGTISRTKGAEIHKLYQEACRRLQSTKKAVKKAMMAEIRAKYREQQPVADIVSQLRGQPAKQEEQTEPELGARGQLSDERRRTFHALFTFATSDPIGDCGRRSEAINAVMALSRHQEPPVRRLCRGKQTIPTFAIANSNEEAAKSKPEPKPIPIECLPTQCIFCLGKVDMILKLRTKAFHSRGDLKRHFERKHLRHLPDGEPIDCPHPECNAKLSHKNHLQNHAATVHKTFTWE